MIGVKLLKKMSTWTCLRMRNLKWEFLSFLDSWMRINFTKIKINRANPTKIDRVEIKVRQLIKVKEKKRLS